MIRTALVIAVLFTTASVAAADRIVLRNLTIISDKKVELFNEDGVRLDDGSTVTWDQIERISVAPGMQKAADRMLADLGIHLYRIRTRLKVGDYEGLLPHAEAIVFERVVRERFRVLSSSLWLLDLEAGRTQPLRGGARQLRFARPSPAGSSLGAVDRQSGELRVTALDREDGLGEAMALLGEAVELDPPPPPPQPDPPPSATVVEVPYLHQLWDTPDDFDGGWSCGPTSCLMVVQKYQKLPDHPISCSWPDPHTSLWGWYVPNEYSFAGYTYDIDGLAKGDVWVKGAHGFICRELGAAYWAYMVDFCNQHGLTSWQAGTSFGALTAEIDAGYPMYASTSVLGYGHIIVLVGYDDASSSTIPMAMPMARGASTTARTRSTTGRATTTATWRSV